MNKEKIISTIAIICIGVALVLAGYNIRKNSDTLVGAASSINSFGEGSITTATSTAVGTSAVAMLSGSNASRKFALLSNMSAGTVYCTLSSSGTGFTATSGIPIIQNSSFEINANKLYTGQIYCLTATGTSTVGVIEAN